MVEFRVSQLELCIESHLGVMKYQGQLYQVDIFRVKGMATLCMRVNILRTQNFDIHWYHSLDLRYDYQMIYLK